MCVCPTNLARVWSRPIFAPPLPEKISCWLSLHPSAQATAVTADWGYQYHSVFQIQKATTCPWACQWQRWSNTVSVGCQNCSLKPDTWWCPENFGILDPLPSCHCHTHTTYYWLLLDKLPPSHCGRHVSLPLYPVSLDWLIVEKMSWWEKKPLTNSSVERMDALRFS